MIKRDLLYLAEFLAHIKQCDVHVLKAKAIVERDLAILKARKGQMRESYDVDYFKG